MKVSSFMVERFRSVIDSGWCNLSADGVTALVGQNESGKTSLLQALRAFEEDEIADDDLRANEPLPTVHVAYYIDAPLAKLVAGLVLPEGVEDYIQAHGSRVSISRVFGQEDGEVSSRLALDDPVLAEMFLAPWERDEEVADEGAERPFCTSEEFAQALFDEAPLIALFLDDESLLPARIDVGELQNKDSKVFGRTGAMNYLAVAGVNLGKLITAGARSRKKILDAANEAITERFREFWTQTVGGASQVEFECELKSHELGEENPGGLYLEFWVKDEGDALYPGQRSKGITWFVSFFLALESSARGQRLRLMLVDEPGVSLHAKAQQGVLRLLESLSASMQVVYTTHSPYLIDAERLYRVLAVQRVLKDGYAETQVLSAHKLGSAERDTMFPVLTAMGMDLSGQNVVQKKGNVVLEEISAVYYLKAFAKLRGSKKTPHYIAASGVTNVLVYANLFTGWGLGFGVALDYDTAGQRVKRKLQEHVFLGDAKETNKHVALLPSGAGIEDAFSRADFRTFVLEDPAAVIDGTNSAYMKNRAKGVAAAAFLQRVEEGKVTLQDFDGDTQSAISKTLESVEKIAS